jgi:hypothetical protein
MNVDKFRKPIVISQSNKSKSKQNVLQSASTATSSQRPVLNKQESVKMYGSATNSNVESVMNLISSLRSRNSQIVKTSLQEIVHLVEAPQYAEILNNLGGCEALIELLDLDPLNHFQIVGLSLYALQLLSLSSPCSLKMASNSRFLSVIENFLRTNSSITQQLSSQIICRCFLQPVQSEHLVINNSALVKLFLRCLDLPDQEIQIRVLSIFESLTYHCDNTTALLIASQELKTETGVDLLQQLIDMMVLTVNDLRYSWHPPSPSTLNLDFPSS